MRCLSMSTLSNHNAFYVLVGCCNRAWTPVSTPLIITNPHRYEPIGQYKSDLFLFFLLQTNPGRRDYSISVDSKGFFLALWGLGLGGVIHIWPTKPLEKDCEKGYANNIDLA